MNKDLTVCDMLIYTRNVMEPSQFAQIWENYLYINIGHSLSHQTICNTFFSNHMKPNQIWQT